jgi:hypothetical protein
MERRRARPITIDQRRYLWRFRDALEGVGEGGPRRFRSTFTAYLAERKQGQLIVTFVTWEDDHDYTGNPLRRGFTVTRQDGEPVGLNLNEPQLARQIILYALAHGWTPETMRTPFRIEDGLALFAELGYEVDPLRPGAQPAQR